MRVLSSNPNVMLIYHFDFFSYIMVYTRIYMVYLSIYQYKPISHDCIGIYWYIPVCTMFVSVHNVIFWYVPSLSQYIQVCTWFVLQLTGLGYYLVHRGSLH